MTVFLYAGFLTLLYLFLTFRTIKLRTQNKTSLGDGGHSSLLKAIRVHANFSEYVPLGLLLLFFIESSGVNKPVVHIIGSSLLIARCIHAYGVSQTDEKLIFRQIGMILTIGALAVSSLYLIYRSLG
jgi:uncharacterized protein